jgi:NarL family two-component system response regulator LiaR
MTSQDRPVSESRLVARGRHSAVAAPSGGLDSEPAAKPSVPVPPAQTSVLVVDEHPLSRAGLSSLLDTAGLEVVGEAESAEPAAAMARHLRPEVIIVDLDSAPAILVAIRLMAVSAPHSHVVVLFAGDDFDLPGALAAGACGCVLKRTSTHEILAAIRAAARGELVIAPQVMGRLIRQMRREPTVASDATPLTPRELETLDLLARGWDNARIAKALYVSRSTVKHHISSILKKLRVDNRLQAAVRAVEEGLIDS